MLKRKPKHEAPALVVEIEPVRKTESDAEPVRRDKQENIKASEDCKAMFAALAKARGMSKAELFEDLVAGHLEELQRQGVRVEIA